MGSYHWVLRVVDHVNALDVKVNMFVVFFSCLLVRLSLKNKSSNFKVVIKSTGSQHLGHHLVVMHVLYWDFIRLPLFFLFILSVQNVTKVALVLIAHTYFQVQS